MATAPTIPEYRKLKRVELAPELISDFFAEGKEHPSVRVSKGLPKDAELVGIDITYHPQIAVHFIFRSEDFPSVEIGAKVPETPIEFITFGFGA